MSLSPRPGLEAAVVRQLRAAGCVFAEDEARLLLGEASTPEELTELVDRRVAGLPLEQVLGWAEFCGRRISVEPGVFVPRRRTELLAEEAVRLVREASRTGGSRGGRRTVIVDLCCGSGAVGAVVSSAVAAVELHAVDVDPAAVRCARANLGGQGRVHEGDLYVPLPSALRGQVDVVVANAPYVPTGAIGSMPPEARDHEPPVALDGGVDGLDVQRRVIAEAPRWLSRGGHLLVETSRHQLDGTLEAFEAAGLKARVAASAELDATVVVGTLPRR